MRAVLLPVNLTHAFPLLIPPSRRDLSPLSPPTPRSPRTAKSPAPPPPPPATIAAALGSGPPRSRVRPPSSLPLPLVPCR